MEVNHAFVPGDTLGVDLEATIHVSVSLQNCLHCRKLRIKEKYIYISNDTSTKLGGIGMFRLLMNNGCFVD